MAGGTQDALDGVVAVYDDKFSNAIGDEDSYKFINPDENIAIDRNGTLLSMEGRIALTASDTLPLKIWQYRRKDYSLKLTGFNFSPFIRAFLKDAYLHTETAIDLSSVTTVPFSITAEAASFASGRFTVIFTTGTPLPETVINIVSENIEKSRSGITVFPNPVKGDVIGLQLNEPEAGSYNISIYNNCGQKVYSGLIRHSGGLANYNLLTGAQMSKGVYSMMVVKGDKKINKMILVE